MIEDRFDIFSKYFTVSLITDKAGITYSLNLKDLDITRDWPRDLHLEIPSMLANIDNYPEITAVDFGGDYQASADFNAKQKTYLDSLFAVLIPLIEKSKYVTKFKCEFWLPNELIIGLIENKNNLSELAIFVKNNNKIESGLLPVANAINKANLKSLKLCLENKHFAFILEILRKNTSLNELNLVNISITDFYQANELAVAIQNNTTVNRFGISFDNEEITSKDLENDFKGMIASGIALNKYIQEVEMDFSILHHLNLVLISNQTLKKITNTNCNFLGNINVKDVQNFINIIYTNRTIKNIDFDMNGLNDGQYALLDQILSILSDFINIVFLDKTQKSFKLSTKILESAPDRFITLYSKRDIWNQYIDFSQEQCQLTSNKRHKRSL